jgi:hypothetical protein
MSSRSSAATMALALAVLTLVASVAHCARDTATDTDCATGPERDPAVPLQYVPDTHQYPHCAGRCDAEGGAKGIETFASVPSGPCTGPSGTCSIFTAVFCGAKSISCERVINCACANGTWACTTRDLPEACPADCDASADASADANEDADDDGAADEVADAGQD